MAETIHITLRRDVGDGRTVELRIEVPEFPDCEGSVGFAWLIEWQAGPFGDPPSPASWQRLMAHRAERDRK